MEGQNLPKKGLHHDFPEPGMGGMGGMGKLGMLIESAPLLLYWVKRLPAFFAGFVFCLLVFTVYWGSEGISETIFPNIRENCVLLTLTAAFSQLLDRHFSKRRQESDEEIKFEEGQVKTEVLYRAPKLD